MRTLFFVVNFGAGILAANGCIISLVSAFYEGASFATLGGLFFLAPSMVFARSEWLAFYRRDEVRERRLGWTCLGLAGLAAFGLAANVAEGLSSSWPSGFGWFVACGLAITAYLVGCGVSRVWRCSGLPTKKPSRSAFE
jgi:hypothetical protein